MLQVSAGVLARGLAHAILAVLGFFSSGCASPHLASWRDGSTKDAIESFVERTTDPSNPDYVQPDERVAVFDNDGTLWAEQPVYFQLLFAMDRVKAMAPHHPEWRDTEPFKSVLAGDPKALAAQGEHGVATIIAATHAGMSTEQFAQVVRDWITSARHPRFNRPYIECVYQPMLELLSYLRLHGFKTFIVSGGGVEFMRVFAEEVYGIPPEQVVGSSGGVDFEVRDGLPVLIKQAKIDVVDDKAGKPIAINLHIGRRPIVAFGNSDGDTEMLLWTHARPGASLCAIVHHDDAAREWQYDRTSHVGKLDAALDAAITNRWLVVSIKDDWGRVFPADDATR